MKMSQANEPSITMYLKQKVITKLQFQENSVSRFSKIFHTSSAAAGNKSPIKQHEG